MSRFKASLLNGLIFIGFFALGAGYGWMLGAYTMVEGESLTGVIWADGKIKKDEAYLVLGVVDPEWDTLQEIVQHTLAESIDRDLTGYLVIVDGETVAPEDYFINVTPEICRMRIVEDNVAWGECEFTIPIPESSDE
jgi:hypothetical protein